MDKINFPINLNEVSDNVANLHKALKALGYPIDEQEQLEIRAGESTLRQVRALQASLRIQVNQNILIDNSTAAAINKILEERGLLVEERPFGVSGKTLKSTGETVPNQQLYAFDVTKKEGDRRKN